MNMKRLTATIILYIFTACLLFSAEPTVTIEPYTKDEFPSWAHDLRRAEIVTFGSLPFTTLSVTMVYQLCRWGYEDGFNFDNLPNPLAKSSDDAGLDQEEAFGILIASLCVSLAVGITDIVFSTIERKQAENKRKSQTLPLGVQISPVPISADDSLLIITPQEQP